MLVEFGLKLLLLLLLTVDQSADETEYTSKGTSATQQKTSASTRPVTSVGRRSAWWGSLYRRTTSHASTPAPTTPMATNTQASANGIIAVQTASARTYFANTKAVIAKKSNKKAMDRWAGGVSTWQTPEQRAQLRSIKRRRTRTTTAATARQREQRVGQEHWNVEDEEDDEGCSGWMPMFLCMLGLVFVEIFLACIAVVLLGNNDPKKDAGQKPPPILPVAETLEAEVLDSKWLGLGKDLKVPDEPATFSPQYTHNEHVNYLYSENMIRQRARRFLTPEIVEGEKNSTAQFKQDLLKLEKPPLPYNKGTKGIVITCRLGDFCLTNLMLMVHTHKTKLPIELWLQRNKTQPCVMAALQQKVGDRVTVRYIDDLEDDYCDATSIFVRVQRAKPAYRYKLMAITMSSFEKVLLVDEDSYLVQTPDQAMETCIKAAGDTGAVFWHDVYGISPESQVWSMIGVETKQGYSQESGLVYIDKSVAWRGLYLAAYMNQRQNAYYNMILGDKDTYFLAFESLGMKYKWVPYVPYILCNKANREKANGVSFLQPDVDGVPLSVHLVSGKNVFASLIEREKPCFTHVWTYDPNKHCASKKLRIIESIAQNNQTAVMRAGVIEPSSKFIGNFPDVLAAHFRAARLLLNNCTRTIASSSTSAGKESDSFETSSRQN